MSEFTHFDETPAGLLIPTIDPEQIPVFYKGLPVFFNYLKYLKVSGSKTSLLNQIISSTQIIDHALFNAGIDSMQKIVAGTLSKDTALIHNGIGDNFEAFGREYFPDLER